MKRSRAALVLSILAGCTADLRVGANVAEPTLPRLYDLSIVGDNLGLAAGTEVLWALRRKPEGELVVAQAATVSGGGDLGAYLAGALLEGQAYSIVVLVDRAEEASDTRFACDADDRAWIEPLGATDGDVHIRLVVRSVLDSDACDALPVPGDINADGCVDEVDEDLLAIALSAPGPRGPGDPADLDYDGTLGPSDVDTLECNFGHGCSDSWEWSCAE